MPSQETVLYDTNQMVLSQSTMRLSRSFPGPTVEKGNVKSYSLVAETFVMRTVS